MPRDKTTLMRKQTKSWLALSSHYLGNDVIRNKEKQVLVFHAIVLPGLENFCILI